MVATNTNYVAAGSAKVAVVGVGGLVQPSATDSWPLDYSVSRVNFMVKLLRACVWMPWRK